MLACYARNEFPSAMIKIPAFVIGGLLILTGIAGYVLQDPGLSLKITGPLAEDAQLVLSDGKQKHELDLGFASSDAAGEHAYWLIYNLNAYHAKDSSQGNYAVDQTGADYEKKSFWYASSKGETMDALLQESNNYKEAGNEDQVEIDWGKVDKNSSIIRFVFKNQADSPGPITLQSNNWKNINVPPSLKPNEKIVFSTSPTAFIPGLLGIILILLTLGAAKMPSAHKHFMHVAVLVALICFCVVSKMLINAYSEMTWLKSEPYMIIHVSSLKPTTMLLTAGLLLIFVILCVVSFIEARKNRLAEESKKAKNPSAKKEASEDKKTKESKDKNDSENESSSSSDKSNPSEKPSGSDKEDQVSKNKEKGKDDTSLKDSKKTNSLSDTEKLDKPSNLSNKPSSQPSLMKEKNEVSETSKDKETDSLEKTKDFPSSQKSTEPEDKKTD